MKSNEEEKENICEDDIIEFEDNEGDQDLNLSPAKRKIFTASRIQRTLTTLKKLSCFLIPKLISPLQRSLESLHCNSIGIFRIFRQSFFKKIIIV